MFGPAHCCCTLLQVPVRVLPPVSNVPATEVEMVCPELWRAVVVVDRFYGRVRVTSNMLTVRQHLPCSNETRTNGTKQKSGETKLHKLCGFSRHFSTGCATEESWLIRSESHSGAWRKWLRLLPQRTNSQTVGYSVPLFR